MNTFPYQRIDLQKLPPAEGDDNGPTPGTKNVASVRSGIVRWWIIPLSLLLCCAQAILTILGDNVFQVGINSTLIPVISFGVLFVLVLAVNPLLGLLKRGSGTSTHFNRIELICLFTTMFVTSGLSTFGLASQVVPMIPAPWNPTWNTPQSGWSEDLTHPESPLLNPRLYIQDEASIRMFNEGVVINQPPEGASFAEVVAYHREVLRMIPWGMWFGPVGFWLIFIFGCLGIFYSLSYVVLRFWADREKLIFCLAQLPEAILPSDSSRVRLPTVFYRPGFWAGFALSALVLSWNASISAGWILPDFTIPLGLTRTDTAQLFKGSWFDGLLGGYGSIRFLIVFTAVGIAFLLPVQISFSTWFYFLLAQLMILIAIWIGLGENFAAFPSDFISTSNFLTAQGGGALLAFAAISLFRCLKEYYTLSLGKTGAERWQLLVPVIWLACSTTVVVVWLLWNQISLFWALVFVLFFTLFSIGMMRIVAETGIYFFQANFGFFHAFNAFGLGKLVPGALIAPLMPIYAIFFMDIKTFVAPNLLTAAKIQKDDGHGRRIYHWNMILCIVVSVLFSIACLIYLAHQRGAQQMNAWFFGNMAPLTLAHAKTFVVETQAAISSNAIWTLIGGAWLCFTLWVRKSVFWFPHPIGYILLFNPLLATIWFSFFIGWIFKKLTVKYGGKSTFDLIKPVFLGLIFGELLAISIWMIVGLLLGFSSGIDLNRV